MLQVCAGQQPAARVFGRKHLPLLIHMPPLAPRRGCKIRILCGCNVVGGVVSVGYADANPRLGIVYHLRWHITRHVNYKPGGWVCNRAAVVGGGGGRVSPHSRLSPPMWGYWSCNRSAVNINGICRCRAYAIRPYRHTTPHDATTTNPPHEANKNHFAPTGEQYQPDMQRRIGIIL